MLLNCDLHESQLVLGSQAEMGVIEDDEEGGTGRFILEQVLGPTVARFVGLG